MVAGDIDNVEINAADVYVDGGDIDAAFINAVTATVRAGTIDAGLITAGSPILNEHQAGSGSRAGGDRFPHPKRPSAARTRDGRRRQRRPHGDGDLRHRPERQRRQPRQRGQR